MSLSVRVRIGVLLLTAVALFTGACSVEDVMTAPDCDTGGSIMIAAQSVPTADMVPCLRPLPPGWEISTVKIDQSGTAITLNSDRAGDGAARLRFAESCDRGESVAVPSEQEGADRYEMIEAVQPEFESQRYYLFPGGCVWWEFDFSADASAALSIELGDTLLLVSRSQLNENLRESFIDEEL